MMRKAVPTDIIREIVVGNKDIYGNLITNVISRGNEYAVYEINSDNIQQRLRLMIDGYDDDREAQISGWYMRVKEVYMKARVLLYKSEDYNIIQSRIAVALATALSGYPEESLRQFDNLIKEVNDEDRDKSIRRICYVVPGYILLIILAVILAAMYFRWIDFDREVFLWMGIVFTSIIGGVLSLTINLPKIRFYIGIGKGILAVFGLERITISILSGFIGVLGVKAKVVLGGIFGSDDIWVLLFFAVVSAFSEKLVPNMIMNIEGSEIKK